MGRRVEGDCSWKATLAILDDGLFQFTDIDTFGVHCEKCIKTRARFTSAEVDFQELFPVNSRSLVAKVLKQTLVDDTTFSMRSHRAKQFLTETDRSHLVDLVKGELVKPEVSNLQVDEVGSKKAPNEAYRLLQLLSYIERNDNARARAFFETQGERRCLSMLTFIWPEGINLLRTHSDAIFCDSMWNINEDGDHILTIVVVDKEEKLRLAASAIAFRENLPSWEQFFCWVKECVPEFTDKCQCIVTDGADFIHTAFVKAVKPKVLHVSCWWHRNRAIKRWFGKIGAIAKHLQTMVYADTVEELVARENDVLKKLQELEATCLQNASVRQKDIDDLYDILNGINERAFINLTVYTAGTLSNSYAESINSCLRKIGLNALGTSRLNSIFSLRNYCKSDVRSIKLYSNERRVLLEAFMEPPVMKFVSNGVLRHQAKQLEDAEKICRVVGEDGSSFTVQEKIEKMIRKDLKISRIATRLVTWDQTSGKISCSCNGPVYRGMPCVHLSLVAITKNFKIPLFCFNERFCYLHPRARQPEPDHSAGSSPPSPDHDQHSPDEARVEVNFIPGPEQHITEAFLNARFGDDESVRLRGELRAVELLLLQELKPLCNFDEVHQSIQVFKDSVKAKVNELRHERGTQGAVVPHPERRNRNDSYITVPQKVARACAAAMADGDMNEQNSMI